LTTRLWRFGLVGLVILGLTTLGVTVRMWPDACTRPDIDLALGILRRTYGLQTSLVTDVSATSGGPFSASHDCTMLVTEFRISQRLAEQTWLRVTFRVPDVRQGKSVVLGGREHPKSPLP
jgi:hypothetical protein